MSDDGDSVCARCGVRLNVETETGSVEWYDAAYDSDDDYADNEWYCPGTDFRHAPALSVI